MKRLLKSMLALLLVLLMFFEISEVGIVCAAEEIDKAINPAEHIELTVPERFRDGGSWFFIPTANYTASEKSTDKLYIPIQRTGDLEAEAEVTLKVIDLSAHHDVNYTVEIYKETVEPELIFGDMAIVDIMKNADGVEEIEPIQDENELGEMIYEAGGADLVDGEGNTVATITATPLDENGNPIVEEPETPAGDEESPAGDEEPSEEPEGTLQGEPETGDAAPVTPGAVEEGEWSEPERKLSPTQRLRAARNAYTGTTSDRQELAGSDTLSLLNQSSMTEEEANQAMADAVAEDYPGKEYRLHYNPGEEAKFLVITPLYSPEAEGDSMITLMLKEPGEGYGIGEDVNPVTVVITDEDEPEPVYIDMASDTVVAENGVAVITVNRSGRINALKGVNIASWDGSARQGDEYSGIGAKLYFSMGLTTRSVQIPVYHGTEEKDFYVTITALADEQITLATTHVIIPAAEVTGGGSLMGVTDVSGHPLTDPVNVRAGHIELGDFQSDTGFFLSTRVNKEENALYWFDNVSNYGYAYDGIYVHYDATVKWCDAVYRIAKWNPDSIVRMHQNVFDSRGDYPDHWLFAAWGDPKAPNNVTIEAENEDNEGPVGTDSYAEMVVDEVRLIKRQFEIKLEPAAVKPLIGVSNIDVLTNYESVYLDGNTYTRQTHWTEDSFSVTAKTKSPLRLAGLEAQTADGKWVRISTIDGKSSSAVVTLDTGTVNYLQSMGVIRWTANGAPSYREQDQVGYSGTFYKGTITVRPVFDYIDVEVEVQADDKGYGSLCLPAPNYPASVFDFNGSDMAMDARFRWTGRVSWSAYTGSDADAYVFNTTPNGGVGQIALNTFAPSVNQIRYAKIRLKNLSDRNTDFRIYASINNGGLGPAWARIFFENDPEWREYIVDLTQCEGFSAEAWNGEVSWLRFDLGWDRGTSNDQFAIDYIAFFPDEASARVYQPGSYTAEPVQLAPGRYTYHLGDVLTFTSVISELGESLGMGLDGVQYELRTQGSTGAVLNANTVHYINDTIDLRLAGETSGGAVVDRPYYKLKPTFTHKKNQIMVQIRDEDLEALDTTQGFLAEGNHISVIREGDITTYVVATNIRANDLYALTARSIYDDSVPVWTMPDGSEYSGSTFYMLSNPLPDENIITLTVPENQRLGYAVISGTVTTSTYNLNTERSALNERQVENAWVTYEDCGTWSNKEGKFELPAILCAYSTRVRFLVEYNGITAIQEVGIPGSRSQKINASTQEGEDVRAVKADGGIVKMQSFSAEGAHVESVFVQQNGLILGAVDALRLNGKWLTVELGIAGGQYVLDNRTYTENILDVTLYFMDQSTGAVHGSFSSNVTPEKDSLAKWGWVPDEAGGGTFTLDISEFKPGLPNDWNYGDVLMVQLTTDKRSVTTFFTGENEMRYEPVSTGYAVISDPSYEIATFDFDIDDMAELLNVEPATDEDGDLLGDDKRASFGAFPYIGEITAMVHVFSFIASSATGNAEMTRLMGDLSSMSLDDEDEADYDWTDADMEGVADVEPNGLGSEANPNGNGTMGKTHKFQLNVLVKFDETFYGGVRFMLGLIVSYGGGRGYESQKNPLRTAGTILREGKDLSNVNKLNSGSDNQIHDGMSSGDPFSKEKMSNFGGPYFKISAYVGFYIDFGYIELKEVDENGVPQKSHDAVFMGAGGFIGFGATVGYTWAFSIAFIPMYVNVEAGVNLTMFLGTSADPNKTLAEYEKLEDFKDKGEVHAQDYSLNFDFKGRIYVSGTFGVGVYKLIGVRITVEVIFEFGYGNNITKWWPELFDTGWGYVMEAGFAGTIDLLVTSIPVYSASWPLPVAAGYLYYFQEVRRANKCISYVETGIKDGHGTQADRDTAYQMCRELEVMVDAMTYDTETIKDKTYALKKWAYDHDIITWTTANAIEMNKQGGLVGTAMNAALQDDAAPGFTFHTNPHVNSQFVGNEAQLMAAYGIVQRSDVVTDAYAQPSSKIISIGDGLFLMTFLDDTPSRDAMQAATLKWTIYNSADGSWTEPQVVQNDATADSRPNLVDAGDRIILSWASATDEKYEALKQTFAQELQAQTGVEPSPFEVREAMEGDPARVMSIMDIFTVEFDKASQTFGPITQLTDDEFYDDFPQAVYDSGTKDIILLYNKTGLDDEDYASAGDKLMDLISAGPDPEKTYSVIAYMLYNGVQEPGDPFDVGWVTEGFYPSELPEGWTGEDYLAQYGPERILPSTIKNADGDYADPPISDLTVAAGLDHLAAFAFTVDRDFDLKTTEDRELYVQYYNFNTHGVYYPLRVAGDRTDTWEDYNPATRQFETRKSTVQVEVGAPRLIRNGGSTFLFWREDGQTLKYLNVSELLNAKVAGTADDHDGSTTDRKDDETGEEYYWKYAVQDDGTYATDAGTGEIYAPRAMKVDFGSLLTDGDIEITDYEVITDEDDNLYVVWTDAVARKDQTAAEPGGNVSSVAQEIYASAMIRQEEESYEGTDVDGSACTAKSQTARWSKPYRITRDDDFNDGIALALDEDGGLIIVHNRFSKLTASSEEEAVRLVQEGKLGLTQDQEGNLYAASLTYNSPVTLSISRCEKVGSLEATLFEFSDYMPVAGETILVEAAIENVGLIDAQGCEVEFYEFKDGVRGRKIGETYTSDERIMVNTARKLSFEWTVPADGPEGYCIEAVIREKRPDGSWYDNVSSYSKTFTVAPGYYPSITDVVQEGDQFRVSYRVANRGNAPAKEGTTAVLRLEGLYGDLDSELYGYVKDEVLYSADITDQLPAKTAVTDPETGKGVVQKSVFVDEQYVTIPASVFRFCGYDAIVLELQDADGNVIEETSQKLVSMDSPMNLNLNEGKSLGVNVGEEASVKLSYNTTAFVNNGPVVYSVADPDVAEVTADGTLMALSGGTTTLTATLLPSGRSTSVEVEVYEPWEEEEPIPSPAPEAAGDSDSVTLKAEEVEALKDSAVTVELEGASVTLDAEALKEAAEGKDVNVTVTKNEDGSTTFAVTAEGEAVDTDIKVEFPASGDGQVLVLVLEDGTEKVVKKSLVEDGTAYAEIPAGATVRIEDRDVSFPDVAEGAWYEDAVDFVSSHELFQGTDRGFEPNTSMTRAMLATVLYRLEEGKAVGANPFADVAEGKWYTDAITWASAAGIVNGTGNGFEPDTPVTREQIATMLYRYASYLGLDTEDRGSLEGFTDGGNVSSWAADAMAWAVSVGLFQGDDTGALNPGASATRAEVATLFQRLVGILVK